jgi:hypothetical protein
MINNTEVHEVLLHELPRGRHRVEYLGETLVEASDDPAFDAARALLARGMRGRMQTRMAGSPHASLRLSIEWGARTCTRESPTEGPRFAKWRDPAEMGCGWREGPRKTAILPSQVPQVPKRLFDRP